VEWSYVESWREQRWPEIGDLDGLIVLGGEMNADDDLGYPFMARVRDYTFAALQGGVPVFGICLGAQVLARALGARVRPAPVREIGFSKVTATPAGELDPVLAPFAPAASVFQFHEDLFELPAGAELLFTGDTVRNQAFRFGEAAYGVQFHFEVDAAIIADWCDETPRLEEDWGTTKEALLAGSDPHFAAQGRMGADAVARWLELVEHKAHD
jgi:GMP synthase (glutamine-hydrolysing)